ncbi:MAG: sigma-70 family RNA polymerase sigma factor [Planctomycetaceae bacterium]|nr:sigma-70 family RNA polymerase sigma factor [Planctomycetaceae bacterium]MCA9099095.1 sigma-70 family RNA polymerase sigma factor [Planctomycetaceae bacterium]
MLDNSITDSGSTPLSLLHRVQASDSSAWFNFCELYAPLVYYWSRSSGLCHEDTEDLTQQVFSRVAQSISRFEKNEEKGHRFRAWLWTLTRHLIQDFYRSQNRRIRLIGGDRGEAYLTDAAENTHIPVSGGVDDDSSTPQDEIRQLFLRMLEQIRHRHPERNWTAFWRVVVEGELTSDVALDLGMSVNHVRQTKCRILKQLRKEFGEFLE